MTKNSAALNRNLFIADNLYLLEQLDNESIDLICIDPPFAKNQTWVGTLRPPLSDEEREQELATLADWGILNRAEAADAGIEWPDGENGLAKFQDIWRWEDDVHEDWLQKIKRKYKPLNRVVKATRHTHGEDTAAYLTYMAIRLIEMHRVLKPTGSLYLHCDPTASHYLKTLMDGIFGRENFRNEIVWAYSNRLQRSSAGFASLHDVILVYGKTDNVVSNPIYDENWEPSNTQRRRIENGYEERKGALIIYDEDKFQKSGIDEHSYSKVYRSKVSMPPIGDVWNIPILNPMAKERTGYPTQKPVAIAERIIKASTNPGDIVLDCFAGCAYVPVAAERNGRNWIACDMSPRALTVLRRQFAKFRYAINGERQGDEPALIADADVTVRSPKDLPVRTDEDPEPATRTKDLPPRKFKQPASIIPEKEMLEFLLDLSGYMAWCCGFANRMPDGRIVRTTNNFHLDHTDPWSKGGSNQIPNRAPMCPRHNIQKSNRGVYLREYREEIADAGEMLVNTTDDLINLAWAADRALARHVQEAVKHGVQGKL